MLSDAGFIRPTYQEILEENIAYAKELFGEDVETSELTPLGKYIRLYTYKEATLWEVAEAVYYSAYPDTARGVSLDRVCTFASISRNPPTYAVHGVKFTGTPGYEIETGFLVKTDTEVAFHTLGAVTIGEDGTVEAEVECNEWDVVGNVPLGSISIIVNPNMNVSEVEHTRIIQLATSKESDPEFRDRFHAAHAGSGAGTADAIRAAVMRVQNVSGCIVIENDSAEADSEGRPPNSFECYVTAPESVHYEVAEAIFAKKPLGIKAVGDIAVEVSDSGGTPHTVRFSAAEQIVLYFNVEVKVNSYFGSDGAAQIQEAIEKKINALENGDDVILNSLYGAIYGVEGVAQVSVLSMSTNGTSYSTDNIAVSPAKVARTAKTNISVVVSDYEDK